MPDKQVQIVQHLQPGGIETMALDFVRLSGSKIETHIISLKVMPQRPDKNGRALIPWKTDCISWVKSRVSILLCLSG